jgi:hypothetical protein
LRTLLSTQKKTEIEGDPDQRRVSIVNLGELEILVDFKIFKMVLTRVGWLNTAPESKFFR